MDEGIPKHGQREGKLEVPSKIYIDLEGRE